MAKPIPMPSLSPTMKEGKIVKWLKKVGDKVSSGEAIAEVETDKSNLEIEAYDDGVLLQIAVPDGGMAQVGAPIAYVGAKGEKVEGGKPSAPAPAAPAPAPAPAPAAAPAAGGEGIPVLMPSLSPTMTEGKILAWRKKVGDKVSSGEIIAEIETDKSNLEIESYEDGTLAKIVVGENQMAKVGAPIAFIAGKGGKAAAAAPAAAPQAQAPKAPTAAPAAAPAAPRAEAPKAAAPAGGRVRASPLAKRMAKERGLDLASLHGSGPLGRVVKKDIETALAQGVPAAPKAPAVPARAPVAPGVRPEPKSVPISSMRRVIAQRMSEVKPGVPHFYLTVDVEMDAAMKIREEAKALESKVSVNDIIVKAAAIALRRYPKINVSLQGDHIVQYATADVGIAVALEEGLITPIIRDADQKGLAAISAESGETGRARAQAGSQAGRVLGRLAHRVQPGHVRDRPVRRRHQPAAGGHPRGGLGGGQAGRA